MALVLFDLDHTLLTGDSEEAWVRYLKDIGWLSKEFLQKKIQFDQDYNKGKLNTFSYSSFLLEPLTGRTLQEIDNLVKPFAAKVVEDYSDSLTQKLIQDHSKDKCLLVSATLSFIVKEISILLGLKTFFGTEAEVNNKAYTGVLKGIPNFSEEKVRRVKEWSRLERFPKGQDIFAYSDSIYDLPLLEFSDHPRPVNPDKTLRGISSKRGWKIIERSV